MVSVVDYQKLYVDDISTDKNDDLSFSNGHYYSAKAIGVPLIGIPVYWFIRNFTPLAGTNPFYDPNIYIVRFFVATLPFAILGAVMFGLSRRMGIDRGKSLYMVLAYSFGSIALNHSMIFSGHETSAAFCFFSFAIIYCLKKKAANGYRQRDLLYSFAAGSFLGIGALSDYTAMYIAILLVIYIFATKIPIKLKLLFMLGGIPFLTLLLLYNHHCFGSILSFSYNNMSNEEFMGGASQGFLGITLPDPDALYAILLSPSRGLFFIMPVFLYSFLGFFRMLKNRKHTHEAILIILIFTGYLFINSGFYGWHAGWTYGPRYLVPMLPFLAIPMAFSLQRSLWFFLLLGLSAFQVLLSSAVFFHIPQEIVNPLPEIIIPFISAGFTAINAGNMAGIKGPLSLLPVIITALSLIALLIRSTRYRDDNQIPQFNKILAAILALFIVLSLSMQSTKPGKTVHCARAHFFKIASRKNLLKKGIEPLLIEYKKCSQKESSGY